MCAGIVGICITCWNVCCLTIKTKPTTRHPASIGSMPRKVPLWPPAFPNIHFLRHFIFFGVYPPKEVRHTIAQQRNEKQKTRAFHQKISVVVRWSDRRWTTYFLIRKANDVKFTSDAIRICTWSQRAMIPQCCRRLCILAGGKRLRIVRFKRCPTAQKNTPLSSIRLTRWRWLLQFFEKYIWFLFFLLLFS